MKELEEVLAEETSMDKDKEMAWEKSQYEVKRAVMVRQKVVEEEDEDEVRAKVRVSQKRRRMSPCIGLGCQ